ncbi:DUF58 domain-containing protein [Thalassotalea sp. HSM 43]|uniref:DUF58 domain-containing protein n=1 Tax=Thalassotalea sp. HSM 43 TaxID=2552945 RepID=UPI0010802F2A|nr:DUF58 domain-containing protein [Thalassotalea sp. HSM 43]QBY03337.1 DUF58 domain-containing protein [Thalassotalea sp. HSM 43]
MWWKKIASDDQNQLAQATLEQLGCDGINIDIEQLLPYQGKASLLNLAPKKAVQGHLSGNYLARTKGRGMEFDEVRHYQTGDDIRAIDWRVTARTGKTHTKLFREEVERPVLIATDLGQSMFFGSKLLFKSAQACHIAALVAWHAKKRGDRVGGLVFNEQQHQELKPRSRQNGVLHYLHTLEELHQQGLAHWQQELPSSQTYFIENCNRLAQLAKPGSLVYLITDGNHFNEEVLRPLAKVSRHCELVICQVNDPLEFTLPQSKQKTSVAITDGSQKQQLLLGDQQTAQRYQDKAMLTNKLKQQLYQQAGARVIHFSAGDSVEHQLKSGIETWIR